MAKPMSLVLPWTSPTWPSPTWAVKWVAVHMAILLGTTMVVLLGGLDLSPLDVFPWRWRGARDAARLLAEYGPERTGLLTATGLPHADPATGMLVGRFTYTGAGDKETDYVLGWNLEVSRRRAGTLATADFRDRIADGRAVLREFERRPDDVTVVPWSRNRPEIRVGGYVFRYLGESGCGVPAPLRVGDHVAESPWGTFVRSVEHPDGTVTRVRGRWSWIPACSSYRALLSEDARTLWLVAEDRNAGARTPARWTVTIDTATGFTVAVDHVLVR